MALDAQILKDMKEAHLTAIRELEVQIAEDFAISRAQWEAMSRPDKDFFTTCLALSGWQLRTWVEPCTDGHCNTAETVGFHLRATTRHVGEILYA